MVYDNDGFLEDDEDQAHTQAAKKSRTTTQASKSNEGLDEMNEDSDEVCLADVSNICIDETVHDKVDDGEEFEVYIQLLDDCNITTGSRQPKYDALGIDGSSKVEPKEQEIQEEIQYEIVELFNPNKMKSSHNNNQYNPEDAIQKLAATINNNDNNEKATNIEQKEDTNNESFDNENQLHELEIEQLQQIRSSCFLTFFGCN